MINDKITIDTIVEFDGIYQPVRDIIKKYTAYSPRWIKAAIKEGCKSHDDLVRLFYENQKRGRKLSGAAGKAAVTRIRGGLYKGKGK